MERGEIMRSQMDHSEKAELLRATALFEKMKSTAIKPQSQTVYISHGDCIDDANKLADMVRAEYGVKDILISEIGPVIGAHSGPGTLALFFLGSTR